MVGHMQQPVIVKARMRTMKKNDFPAPATLGAAALSAPAVPFKSVIASLAFVVRGTTLSEVGGARVGGGFWHRAPV